MKKNDKLFELIHSMSKAEKRHFKISAERHSIGGQNNYIILFDVLEEMKSYDQKLLTDRLEERGISTRHLASDKTYLYQHLLKDLSAHHASKTASLRIKEQLHQVEILYDRGLYTHCLSLMRNAKSLATKYDLYPLLLEISVWEQKTLNQQGDIEEAKNALVDSVEHLALLDNMQAFMKLHYAMAELQRQIPNSRTPEEEEILAEFISHPFLQNETIPLTFEARLHFWQTYALYYYAIDDEPKELEANVKLLEIMDSNPKYAQEFPNKYIEIYSRILTIKSHSSDEDFNKYLDFFRSFPKRIKKARRNVEMRMLIDSTQIELTRMAQLGNFDQLEQRIPELQSLIQRFNKQMAVGEKMYFCYLMAYALIAVEKYEEALKHINDLLNEKERERRLEIHMCGRLLNLIIHFKLGNYLLLQHTVESDTRYLKKMDHYHQTEKAFLKCFRKLSKGIPGDRLGQKAVFEASLKEMEGIMKDEYERKVLEILDILSWLDSQIHGISLKEAKANRQVQISSV